MLLRTEQLNLTSCVTLIGNQLYRAPRKKSENFFKETSIFRCDAYSLLYLGYLSGSQTVRRLKSRRRRTAILFKTTLKYAKNENFNVKTYSFIT